MHDLQQNFKDGLEEKCRVGAANVSFFHNYLRTSFDDLGIRLRMPPFPLSTNSQAQCIGQPIVLVRSPALYVNSSLMLSFLSSPSSWDLPSRSKRGTD